MGNEMYSESKKTPSPMFDTILPQKPSKPFFIIKKHFWGTYFFEGVEFSTF